MITEIELHKNCLVCGKSLKGERFVCSKPCQSLINEELRNTSYVSKYQDHQLMARRIIKKKNLLKDKICV